MADGRHFENGFIAISQPEVIRFYEIWYAEIADADCASKDGHVTKWLKFCKFNMADGRLALMKIVFGLYLDDLLSD